MTENPYSPGAGRQDFDAVIAERNRLRAENDRLKHYDKHGEGPYCAAACSEWDRHAGKHGAWCHLDWPCPTAAALAGTTDTPDAPKVGHAVLAASDASLADPSAAGSEVPPSESPDPQEQQQ